MALGILIALAAAEIASRTSSYLKERKRTEEWAAFIEQRTREKSADPTHKTSLVDIIRPSPYPDVIYQWIPSISVNYIDCRVTINEYGFRGPVVPREKPDGVFRIVGLGDSVMFGNGVHDGEEFLQVMARKLNEAGLTSRVEVVNMAVSGYNTAMEVAFFERVGLAWSPDLVLIDFVPNDFDLPNFISGQTDCLALDRSFLFDWVSSTMKAARQEGEDGFRPLQIAPKRNDHLFEQDSEKVPPQYRHMVGHDGYHRAMCRLAELAKKYRFHIAVTNHRSILPGVLETCRELGIPVILANNAVDKYGKEKGIEKYQGSELTVSDKDPHPSAIQHRILGEYYAQLLLHSGRIQ